MLTKSRAEPPPRYSMMIHNLVPWKGIYFLNVTFIHKCTRVFFHDVNKFIRAEKSSVCHLQIRAVVLGDEWTVALTENSDLLLDILDLILGLLQVDGLDGDNVLCAIIDAFKHLPEDKTGERAFNFSRRLTECGGKWPFGK